MDIETYRLYEFYTLVLPLVISLCISVVAYGRMKEKYMEVRASYEPKFRRSKEYRRYKKYKDMRDAFMEPFLFVESED